MKIKRLSRYHIASIFDPEASTTVDTKSIDNSEIIKDTKKIIQNQNDIELSLSRFAIWYEEEDEIVLQISTRKRSEAEGNVYVIWDKDNLYCDKVFFYGNEKGDRSRKISLEWPNS